MAKFSFNEFFTQVKEETLESQSKQTEASSAQDEEQLASVAEVGCFYSPVQKQEARVTADLLNVRESPSTDKPRIGQLKRGATITVTGVCDDWLSIELQGHTCYVSAKYTDYAKPTATVTASALNVRKGPSTETDKIGSLAQGSTVNILGEEKGWAKILHKNTLGYVSKEYLDIA
ncbi:MAG: SH3 domain-containing protein [Bradymonadales bacterium]|jgi:uncharacterized protein YgiM (DUF1202 family)